MICEVDTGPFLRVGGKLYDEKNPYTESTIEIKPGELVMLPTVESFCMPSNLVGDIKIKFSHSRKGLTPLFGPKVDPHFGCEHGGERLYLWVSNLGLQTIVLDICEAVFTVQFHKLDGPCPEPAKKEAIGPTIAREIRQAGSGQYLGFTDAMKSEVKRELESRLIRVEHGTTEVVIFGIFLVASALLAGALGAVLAFASASGITSEISSLSVLKAASWSNPLLWLFLGFTLLVGVLILAAVFKLVRPVEKR